MRLVLVQYNTFTGFPTIENVEADIMNVNNSVEPDYHDSKV